MRIRIKTFGCRMNICDSEIISSILKSNGLSDVDEYRYNEFADVLILNCCSVREDGHTATLRIISEVKQVWPEMKIVVCGCYATLLDEGVFIEYPQIDAIVKPHAYRSFPYAIRALQMDQSHFIQSDVLSDDLYEEVSPVSLLLPNKAVIVAKGCNQRCAYCIEPYTRGSERCISPATILKNVREMLKRPGDEEVTLVGHLIDNYKYSDIDFAQLLRSVASLCRSSDKKVKYISSHPSTYSDSIVKAVLDNDNVMRVVHLPVQSGSDTVLKRMRRGYTAGDFVRRVDNIRRLCPDMKIVTDIMVGFCGETADDFQASVDLIKAVAPADINIYKFSMRRHTYAFSNFTDDVGEAVKAERFRTMSELRQALCTVS